ncbi:dual specificity protein phosphatase 12-like [Babylonia areolata]|uniref:dual specificity protein phosphatase 12-like n=1 Tax=Babylonia areolata TaxID=304850 RepID=UPI003FD536A2
MTSLDEIMPKLFLGGITGIFEPSALRQRGITHVLTLMDRALPGELMSGFTYQHVFALDMYDHDLLRDMEECLAFVEEGMQQGAVLVHCQVGASRSATVVIAYVMRTYTMSRAAALEFVQLRRPIVSPNQGFLQQLDLFELMGYKVNEAHEEFRRYMLNKIALRSKSGFRKDQLLSSIYRPESSPSAATGTVYKCRKCRRVLFQSDALMPHTKGDWASAYDWHSKMPSSQRPQQRTLDAPGKENGDESTGGTGEGEGGGRGEKCEMSLFVEPMAWMKGQVETVEGKLACPKCSAKLGSFVWYGERCPCGAWVAPAFHIQTGKVDAMKLRVVPLPPGLHTASASPTVPESSSASATANQQAVVPSMPSIASSSAVGGD